MRSAAWRTTCEHERRTRWWPRREHYATARWWPGMSLKRPLAATWLVMLAVIMLGVGGCSETGGAGLGVLRLLAPSWRPPSLAPTPDSPTGVLRQFEWCYNNMSISTCGDLFTADYRFHFSPLDSAGVAYRDTPWVRDDELISTTHLFVGGSPTQPPAKTIRLNLDKDFFVYPDPRTFVWDPEGRWHKNIRTQVFLSIRTLDGSVIDISGAANFYLVRGDSAVIPSDLIARGFHPDSTRWWIVRWDDETAQPETTADHPGASVEAGVQRRPKPLATQPTSSKAWGRLKVLYR